ncbi:MAG: sodium:solute symporter [Bacteroidales bacterium]|nr:sodium:solute symporter [Bacteroidales bacterium]
MQTLVFSFFALYTLLLFVIMWFTSKKATNKTYFTGNRQSPWFVVAYGMIGASLSGVTFMSVPGDVATTQFTYFGVVLGYILGYLTIAYLLMPLYYKFQVTSIYEYLGKRLGNEAHKTGSIIFIISRLMGSALRMYLVIYVLQIFIFDAWNIPAWLTATVMIGIILLYTFRGGIKTVVWTDTLQTTFLLLALVITIVVIFKELNLSVGELWQAMDAQGYTKVFETDWHKSNYFLKHIFGGMFITIVMTGLDQDMMQKNLTCKTLKQAQYNICTFTGILVFVNALFLTLGGLLLVYANMKGIDVSGMATDRIYPEIAFNYLGPFATIVFVIGLISAGYSSADGTLTAITTSICFDIINIEKFIDNDSKRLLVRRLIHIGVSLIFLGIIIVFARFHNDALIRIIFMVASYTYGPILGLFAFGMFSKRTIRYKALIPVIALLAPTLCYLLSSYSVALFSGYKFGFELLIVNGLLTYVGLWAISQKTSTLEMANK